MPQAPSNSRTLTWPAIMPLLERRSASSVSLDTPWSRLSLVVPQRSRHGAAHGSNRVIGCWCSFLDHNSRISKMRSSGGVSEPDHDEGTFRRDANRPHPLAKRQGRLLAGPATGITSAGIGIRRPLGGKSAAPRRYLQDLSDLSSDRLFGSNHRRSLFVEGRP